MINSLKPYPRMKDSGVDWLGEVPEHWAVERLRNVAGLRVSNIDKHSRDGEEPVRLCNYVDVYKHDRITPEMAFMKATAARGDVERFRLHVDDVLITKDSEAWNDIGVPSLVDGAAPDLVSGYHLALLRPFQDRIKGGFLFRMLQSPAGAYQFHMGAKGVTRYGLSHGSIKSMSLPLPPVPEQAAIVRFLDYADRRIRRYIRAKQRLIKLLEEQKQAIIHRAVTRGLDRDVALKDSGGAWLGEVPEHWNVMPLLAVARRKSISGFAQRELLSVYLGRGVIRFSEVGEKRTNVTSEDLSKYQAVDPGDLVLNNQQAWRGSVGVSRHVGIVSPAYLVLGLDNQFNTDFADFLFRDRVMVVQYLVASRGVGSIQRNLYWPNLRRCLVPVPPVAEQDEIARFLGGAKESIGAVTTRTLREIALLRELHTRLIADVVTGKFDVRDVAARLPDDEDYVDEDDDLDENGATFEHSDLDAELEEIEA